MNQRTVKILYLEDNSGDALLLNELLEESPFNWTVTRTDHLGSALRLLDGESFDLVLMDLSLPDCWGGEILQRIRALDPDLPVVVLSGTYSEGEKIELLRGGARDTLEKGRLEPDHLWRVIEIHARRS